MKAKLVMTQDDVAMDGSAVAAGTAVGSLDCSGATAADLVTWIRTGRVEVVADKPAAKPAAKKKTADS